ncbi:hypothetical protein WDU94_010785 [Cyamophila willieti]
MCHLSKILAALDENKEALEKALLAVRSNTLSLNKAASQFNVPKSTVSKKLRGKTIQGRQMGPKPVLTVEEETRLENWIVNKAKIGFPMNPDDVKDAVQNVIKETNWPSPFKDDRPGEKWLALF